MEPARQKVFARLILIILGGLGLFRLSQLDFNQKITTNVIDLIPADERSPEIALLRTLVDERQARIVLLALHDRTAPDHAPLTAAVQFAGILRASPHFAEVMLLQDGRAGDALGAFLFQRRLDYLLPAWLERQEQAFAESGLPESARASWVAEKAVGALDEFLMGPEAAAFQDIIPQDPLLLVPSLIAGTQLLPAPAEASTGHALIWARIAASPLAEAGQEPVFAAIEQALATVQRDHSGVTLQWSGVNRIAAASKDRIRSELSLLNGFSLAAVLLIALIFVRHIWKVLHLVPVILFALLCGWVAVTTVFAQVHILVFVVGALLTGVAIDYGFYLYLQPALRAGETYREKLGRLLKPLLTSCLTTVIGFSFLLLSELPLIRHLGVFVSAGLVGALGAAMLYFAQVDHPYLEVRPFARIAFRGGHGKIVRWLALVALLIALAGPWRLHWQDSIRELEVPNRALERNDAVLRGLFGEKQNQTAYITQGDSPARARGSLARFLAWHARTFPAHPAAGAGMILPTVEDVQATPARLAALDGFEARFRQALEQHEYAADAFEPFFKDWRQACAQPGPPAYGTLVADLQARLTGPLGMLFFSSEHATWFLTLADHPPGADPPAGLDTFGTNQLQTLNSLFARYRESALHLSLMGLGVIGLSVFVLYGLKRGVRIFMIPAGSCLLSFGLLGLAGQTLNMFHLLGAFLGVCLSHNYAIFSAENAGRGEPPPVSIRLSALTTAASFGVLGISRIAVVAALGSTVALIVMTALLLVELESLSRKPRPLAP